MAEESFRCGKCQELRSAGDFPPSQQHNGGYCRPCKRAYEKAHPRKRYKPDRPYSETCYRCHQPRPEGDRQNVGYCDECWRAYGRARYREQGRRITPVCSMCGVVRDPEDRGHQAYCPRCFYIWQLKYKYGITPDDYAEMLAAQGGGCAICGIEQSQLWKDNWSHPLEIDHCHDTGRVRGLLCSSCNTSLGRFKHDVVLLRRAADYVENGGTDAARALVPSGDPVEP